VLRALRRRLDRLWEAHQREKRARQRAGAFDVCYEAVHAEAIRDGIDPKTIPALRDYAEARRPLPAPAQPSSDPIQWLREKLLAVVERHRREPIDPEHATLIELFALHCFIPDEPGVTYLAPDSG
jgi:hypothetical protein